MGAMIFERFGAKPEMDRMPVRLDASSREPQGKPPTDPRA